MSAETETVVPQWEAAADVVIVGSGVAGLTAALRARELGLRVLVVTKDSADNGNTRWAQGGVAVVLPDQHDVGDSTRRHAEDTVTAGAGLCEPDAVAAIVDDGPAAIAGLRALGATFDSSSTVDSCGEKLARTREGGHTAFRVIHAGGDATGAEVQRALLAETRAECVPTLTEHIAVDVLHTNSGAVGGLLVLDGHGVPGVLRAPAVLLATGGIGQLYAATSNPEVATGDGLALALRAGAELADLEFVQFHPTVLFVPGAAGCADPDEQAGGAACADPDEQVGGGRRPLVTEAVRGEGATLIDTHGRSVMAGVHPLGDLAPRDVVSAAIARRMAATDTDHVLLDARGFAGDFAARFPTVSASCAAAGIDPVRQPIPVAPAAHFSCGGVVVGVDGRSTVTGLYAAGEVARTGLHGANRLASNSLLEGLVVGRRAVEAIARDLRSGVLGDPRTVEPARLPAAAVADRGLVQRTMSRYAAIGRDADGLATAADAIAAATVVRPLWTRRAVEDAALTMIAEVLLASAARRTESRGCHVRTDRPASDDAWLVSQRVRLDVAGRPIFLAPQRIRQEAA